MADDMIYAGGGGGGGGGVCDGRIGWRLVFQQSIVAGSIDTCARP